MKRGREIRRLSVAEARRRAEAAAEVLARDPHVRLVYLFGSAADPGATTVRDVDLAIATWSYGLTPSALVSSGSRR